MYYYVGVGRYTKFTARRGGDGGGGEAHAAYHASSGRMKPEEPERCHSTAVFTAGKSRFKKLQFVLIKSDNV